jgi:hypothetical protein
MNIENLIIQLGISGVVVWVGYRLALRLIDGWREAEKERTAAISSSLRDIVERHAAHHELEMTHHVDVRAALARIETRQTDGDGRRTMRVISDK